MDLHESMSMGRTCNRVVVVVPHSPDLEAEQQQQHLRHACGAAALVLLAYSFAVTAWHARHEPRDLAFVAGAAAALGALLLCLRRAERLTPDSPAGERRRVQAAVWALSTALSCAFAHRVAAVMPPALAVLVWGMTSLVVLAGLCMLLLCGDPQQRHGSDDVDGGHGKPFNKIDNNADAFE